MTEPTLAELTEISSQVDAAVLFDDAGKVIGSTLPDEPRRTARSQRPRALRGAGRAGDGDLTQLEAATGRRSLFIVREGRAADRRVTCREPTAGLVFYDLKSTLRSAAKPKPKPKPTSRAGQEE